MKRLLYYLLWLVIISVVLYAGLEYQAQLQENAATTYNQIPVIQFMAVFPVLIGILLRLPKLVLQIRKNKSWTFDWVKLIAIALPAGYIALLPILYFALEIPLFLAMEVMTTGIPVMTTTAGIVFGYILLDSLKSEDYLTEQRERL